MLIVGCVVCALVSGVAMGTTGTKENRGCDFVGACAAGGATLGGADGAVAGSDEKRRATNDCEVRFGFGAGPAGSDGRIGIGRKKGLVRGWSRRSRRFRERLDRLIGS
jgi:hypothetical protein